MIVSHTLADILYFKLNTYHEHNGVCNFSVRVFCVAFSGFGLCHLVAFYYCQFQLNPSLLLLFLCDY